MRWIWIIIWVILLALQLMRGEIQRFRMAAGLAGDSLIDHDLLVLARQTNRTWVEGERHPEEGGSAEVLPDTAELILELNRIEAELADVGVDIKLAEDLESWFLVESRKVTQTDKQSYISGIADWLEPFLMDQASLQVLDRLRLEPCPESGFPELHFELNGSPMSLGVLLFAASDPQGHWRLAEMELVHHEEKGEWWMLGCCIYEPNAQQ